MQIKTLKSPKEGKLFILPFFEGKKGGEPAYKVKDIPLKVSSEILDDFKGKEGETLQVYLEGKRAILTGLGKKQGCESEQVRRGYGAAIRFAMGKKWDAPVVVFPEGAGFSAARPIAEGLFSANYRFEKYRKNNGATPLKKLHLLKGTPSDLKTFEEVQGIFEGVYLTRDLVNTNSDEATPDYLAMEARKIAKRFSSVKVRVLDKKLLKKEGLSMVLTVGKGAEHDPRLIILEYRGDPKSKDKTVVVGKGVTFDTGGLNLKPSGSIETMKTDMGGAATVLGTLLAAAKSKVKKNLTGVVVSVENAIDSSSYKPGDVYMTRAGKSIEIGNTDAEGRLILADALSYTVDKLKPTEIIDFATLTGAIVIALGDETSGLMSNNDRLADKLIRSGEATFERVWRLPLIPEYKERLRSEIADLKNIGGRAGSSIIAGLFLQEFVGDVPWAHIDIAGTAYVSKPQRYVPKLATGVGVRLMLDYLSR